MSDFIAELQRIEQEESSVQKAKDDWYRSLVGRYFKSDSYYISVCQDEDGELYINQLELYISEDKQDICVTRYDHIEFNTEWFNNPYNNNIWKKDPEEISEETYNSIIAKHQEISNNIWNFINSTEKKYETTA